jgi:EspG family
MRLTLSATEFEVAWTALDLGDLPLIFRVRIARSGATDEERALVVTSALEGLRERGLAGARGLAAELAAALRLLAWPAWIVDARLDLDGERHALGAGAGAAAVLAVLDAGTVTIAGSTPCRLPADVAALAGDPPAAPGKSINLVAAVLMEAARRAADPGDESSLEDALRDLGVAPGDARELATINTTLRGSGQFGVEVLDDGAMRRAPHVVGFCDTPEGRWAQLRTTSHGQEWVTFTPAGRAQLAAMIADLLARTGVRAA